MTRLSWLRSRMHHDDSAAAELAWRGALYGLVLAGAAMLILRWLVEVTR
jgi:hypothetical protein